MYSTLLMQSACILISYRVAGVFVWVVFKEPFSQCVPLSLCFMHFLAFSVRYRKSTLGYVG